MEHEKPVKLRVHHLLCFFGWRGVGYTPQFTQAFTALWQNLSWSTPVFLSQDYDSLCACCPKYISNDCTPQSETALKQIDRRCLQALGLASEQIYTFGFLLEKVVALIKPSDLREICDACYWLNLGWCEQGLKNKSFYYLKKNEHMVGLDLKKD